MIATKTTILMVTMAAIGIVPVAAHAQSVDIIELSELAGNAELVSAPSQDQGQANVDEDRNTPVNFLFANVAPGGTSTQEVANVIEDADVLATTQTGTQTAPPTQTSTQTQTPIQTPTLTVAEVLGLFPPGG